jgi:hypothetical protein
LSPIECLTAEDEPISPLPELPVAQDDERVVLGVWEVAYCLDAVQIAGSEVLTRLQTKG